MSGSSRISTKVLLAAFAVGALVGVLAFQLIRDALSPVRGIQPTQEVTLALVGESTTEERQLARLVEQWSPVPAIHSGTIEGRVTASVVDDVVNQGTIVLEVDGIERPALVSSTPLWRELREGDAGDDVEAVADLLQTLGLGPATTSPGRVNNAFMDVVRRFEERYGWELTGIFRPHYVVWVPFEPLAVGSIEARVGSFIEAESVLILGEPEILSAKTVALNVGMQLTPSTEPSLFEIPGELVIALSEDGTVSDTASLSRY